MIQAKPQSGSRVQTDHVAPAIAVEADRVFMVEGAPLGAQYLYPRRVYCGIMIF
jgi:hypothetical protein